MAKVSVLMPVYNGEKYLRQAIDSILSQTYSDIELVIVDDGSRDGSAAIISQYAASDARVRPVSLGTNRGICQALNHGIDISSGEYIARMDCDDIAAPERIERQVAYMDSHHEIGASGTWVRVICQSHEPRVHRFETDYRLCEAGMLFGNCMAHPSVIMRRSVLQSHGLRYDDEYRGIEDYHLWWRMSRVTRIANIATPLLDYRVHPGQVTSAGSSSDIAIKHRRLLCQLLADLGADVGADGIDLLLSYAQHRRQWSQDEGMLFVNAMASVLGAVKQHHPDRYWAYRRVMSDAVIAVASAQDGMDWMRAAAYSYGIVPLWRRVLWLIWR